MPLSTQKTGHVSDAPMPERAKDSIRRAGTVLARMTPPESLTTPVRVRMPASRSRSA